MLAKLIIPRFCILRTHSQPVEIQHDGFFQRPALRCQHLLSLCHQQRIQVKRQLIRGGFNTSLHLGVDGGQVGVLLRTKEIRVGSLLYEIGDLGVHHDNSLLRCKTLGTTSSQAILLIWGRGKAREMDGQAG